MSSFIPGIDPFSVIGSSANMNSVSANNINSSKVTTKEEARREFVSLFVSQVMKEMFKSQASMFGDEEPTGVFSGDLYNEILMSKISGELAKNRAFGFDKMNIKGLDQ